MFRRAYGALRLCSMGFGAGAFVVRGKAQAPSIEVERGKWSVAMLDVGTLLSVLDFAVNTAALVLAYLVYQQVQ